MTVELPIFIRIRNHIAQTEESIRIDLFVAQAETIAALDEPSSPRFRTNWIASTVIENFFSILAEHVAIVINKRIISSICDGLHFRRESK